MDFFDGVSQGAPGWCRRSSRSARTIAARPAVAISAAGDSRLQRLLKGGERDSNPRPPGPQPGALPTQLPATVRRPWYPRSGAAERRLVEPRPQLDERVEDGDRPAVSQLLLGQTARDHAHGLEPGPSAASMSHGESPTITASSRARLLERRVDRGRAPASSARRRPRSSSRRRARARRACSRKWSRSSSFDEVASTTRGPPPRARRQLARALERLALVAQLRVTPRVRRPAARRRAARRPPRRRPPATICVAAHADVAVDPPHRHRRSHDGGTRGTTRGRAGSSRRRASRRGRAARRGGQLAALASSPRRLACLPSQNSSIIFLLNAGMSSGLRLVTRPWSTTTSSSTQFAPALRIRSAASATT